MNPYIVYMHHLGYSVLFFLVPFICLGILIGIANNGEDPSKDDCRSVVVISVIIAFIYFLIRFPNI